MLVLPEIITLLVAGLAGVTAGLLSTEAGWGVAAGLGVFLLRILWEHAVLVRWLKTLPGEPPLFITGMGRNVIQKIRKLSLAQTRLRKRNSRLTSGLKRFRNSLNGLPDAAVILNQKGEIEWFNRSARDFLRLRHKNRGTQLSEVLSNTAFDDLLNSDDQSGTLIMPSPRYNKAYFDFRFLKFDDKKSLVLVRDITRIQRLETMRQDFVANVSHELRTPLTVILGYLEEASYLDSRMEPETMQKLITCMRDPAERMKILIGDLSMLACLDVEKTPSFDDLSHIRVDNLICNIITDARRLGNADHRFQLELQDDVGLWGIEHEIRSAFSNLIFNAVLYSPNGGAIRVVWKRKGQGALFAVHDQGVGIAGEHLPRLTERFYRVDVDRSRSSGGTGLGLAIVKHVLRRHESVLEIESKPGKGSKFSCTFTHHYLVSDAPSIEIPGSRVHHVLRSPDPVRKVAESSPCSSGTRH